MGGAATSEAESGDACQAHVWAQCGQIRRLLKRLGKCRFFSTQNLQNFQYGQFQFLSNSACIDHNTLQAGPAEDAGKRLMAEAMRH